MISNKNLCILGVSGNIGTQSIECIKNNNYDYNLKAVSIGDNIDFLINLLFEFKSIEYVYVKSYLNYLLLKNKFGNLNIYYGDNGLIQLINECDCDVYLNALSGFSGVLPSLSILENNKILLLANKETLVVAGEIVKDYLNNNKGIIYPIDSEHSAIYKCLKNVDINEVENIYLTCSGGPFFNKNHDELSKVTLKEALNHPTYKMGKKITIDSSTLMNKAFEIVEAYYLFNVSKDKIKVVIDRNSYVHSFINLKNGEYKLCVGKPDMHREINDALNLYKCDEKEFKDIEINTFLNYKFYDVDYSNFPLINLGYEIINKKGNLGLIINSSNEVAVDAFLNQKINYLNISQIIDKIISIYPFKKTLKKEDLIKMDLEVKELTRKIIKEGNY